MIQVKLDRKPYAKHTFYKGVYTYKYVEYAFDLTVEESENSAQPGILIEFELDLRLVPFDYDKACKEILAIYIPHYENKN